MNLPDRLQHVDHALIQLLGERMALLAASGVPSVQEQLSSCKASLAAAGVSEHTWTSIVTSCMAGLAATPTVRHRVEPRKVTVVGGAGLMGRFFTERLATAGHQVSVLEYNDWDRAEQLLGCADFVLIAVPLKSTLAVIRKVAPYLAPTATLADIASTKTSVVQAMLTHHPGPVVGLHPMFGPGPESFLGQKVVVCPGRSAHAGQWFLDLIEADGGRLITCTPEEHDRMMTVVQGVRYFANLTLGAFLAEEGIDIRRSLEFASPIYRTEINMVNRLVAQDAGLYVDILLDSDDRCEVISRFAKICDRLSQRMAQGDRIGLIAEFETARQAFQNETSRALRESNHVLNGLTTLLAAEAVETTRSVAGVDYDASKVGFC